MKHGANNHHVKNSFFEGKVCIEKTYGASEQELLKYQRELYFYKFCNKLSCPYVPELYGASELKRSIYIEKVGGASENQFSRNFFIRSLEFIKFLNKHSSTYSNSMLAQEHLGSPHCLSEYLKSRFKQSLGSEIYFPVDFTMIAAKIIKNSSDKIFNFGPRVLNPSDIGLHNALCDNGIYKFIDFEYAGIDYFAKLAYDYYLHPSNFQNEIDLIEFFEQLSEALEIPHQKVDEEIFRLFSLWWVLRLLNHLSPGALSAKLEMNLLSASELPNYISQREELISRYWGYVNA